MRFALITDVHFGPRTFHQGKLRKMSDQAEPLTRRFVDQMNRVERPDLVVNLGDVVEDQSAEQDRRGYAQFLEILSQLEAPVVSVAGNHDQVNLSDADLAALWGRSGPLDYAFDLGDYHFLVLKTSEGAGEVHLSRAGLEHARRDLAQTRRPTVVLMHHPASDQRVTGNRWFERAAHLCHVIERRELRAILEESGKVLAVFNGHVHWNHLDLIGGIPYVTVQSLIENVEDDAPGRVAAAWAVCDLDPERLVVEVRGAEPVRYQVELAAR